MRPMLLGAGIGLFWFVEFQEGGVTADVPAWGYAVALGVRLLLAFVGGWLAVSAGRLVFALGKLGMVHWRSWRRQEAQ